MIIHNTSPWTMCHIDTLRHPATVSLKTLSRKNPVGQKSIIRKKEYSALQVHVTPFKKNNLNHVTLLFECAFYCLIKNLKPKNSMGKNGQRGKRVQDI